MELPSWSTLAPALRKAYACPFPKSSVTASLPMVRSVISRKDSFLNAVAAFGSPLYALDEDYARQHLSLFKSAFTKDFPRMRCFYAFKSNDLPYFIDVTKQEGFFADVASGFELTLALRLGFSHIIFTAPVKSDEELLLAISNREKVVINVDDLGELERIRSFCRSLKSSLPVRVSLRCNLLDEGHQWTKFGLNKEDARKAVALIVAHSCLRWSGVHFHSSWNASPEGQVDRLERLGRLLSEISSPMERSTIAFVDVGGGFLLPGVGDYLDGLPQARLLSLAGEDVAYAAMRGKPFMEKVAPIASFSKAITQAFKKHVLPLLPSAVELWVEPGRYLALPSSLILLRVVSCRGKNVYVDAGIQLVGAAAGTFEYVPIINLTRPSLQRRASTIYGPLCDPDDLWGYSYFGDEAHVGDVLAVLFQGAYTFSTAWRWQRPIPPYVSCTKKGVALVKGGERFEQRYAGCLIPQSKKRRH